MYGWYLKRDGGGKKLYLTKHRNMRVVRIKNESVYNMTKEKFLEILNSINRGEVIKIGYKI